MSTRRYPGAKPFTKDQQAIFYGREEDIERLHRMISLESLSVLYGKSGYGKSSLINAGLVPKLDQGSNNLPILIRFQAWTKNSLESPLDRIQSLLKELPLERKALDKLSPKENSLWYLAKAYQYAHPDRRLILLFDQFEELFSYPKAQIQEFKEQLAELVRGQLPDRYDELLDIAADREEAPLTEEEEEQLYSPLNVRINFSIRSDRMHLLDQLSDYLPNVLLNNLELKALKEEDAVKALVFPAQMPGDFDAKSFSYTDGATKKIMRFLKNKEDGLVEAIQLQILCTSFEDKAIQENIQNFDIDTIGDLDAIIKNFYHDQLAKIENEHDQKAAAKLLEDGLLDKDRKERLTLHESQIRLLFRVKPNLLNQLVDNNLLRREPDRRIGYTYELSHDTLIAPALAAREIREQEEAEKQRILQEKELKEERRKRRNTYAFAVFATMLAIFASLATFVAWDQQRIAEENLADAKREKERADRLSSQATQQLAITQIARDSAKAQKERAELETLRADSLLEVAQNQEALARLEAAKGNKLKETLSGGNVYKYLKNQGTGFYNNGEYRSALTYWANAQFFLDTAIHENPLIISSLIRKAKLGTLAEDDFQYGRLELAKQGYKRLLSYNFLNDLPIQRRLEQIEQAQETWRKAIANQPLDSIVLLRVSGDIAVVPSQVKQLKNLSGLMFDDNGESELFLYSVPNDLDTIEFSLVSFIDLPDIKHLKALKTLRIAGTETMTTLPDYLEEMESIKSFDISNCYSLKRIITTNFPPNIQEFHFLGTHDVTKIDQFGRSSDLRVLSITFSSLAKLPSLANMKQLEHLEISNNDALLQLPDLSALKNLRNFIIIRNEKIESIPNIPFQKLKQLEIANNINLRLIASLDALEQLEDLLIVGNLDLAELPSFDALKNLKFLEISKNNSLIKLPSLDALKNLQILNISYNSALTQIPSLNQLENIKNLNFNANNNIRVIPSLDQLKTLETLDFLFCKQLSTLPSLDGLENLIRLSIQGLTNLELIPSLTKLRKLSSIVIVNNPKIRTIPALDSLKNLTTLFVNECNNLKRLPSFDQLRELQYIHIEKNSQLQTIPSLKKLKRLKELYITNNGLLKTLPDFPEELDSLFNVHLGSLGDFGELVVQPITIHSLPSDFTSYNNLSTLVLSATDITDLPPFFKQFKEKKLQYLNLTYTRMEEETVEKWRRLLPNTEVIFEPRPKD